MVLLMLFVTYCGQRAFEVSGKASELLCESVTFPRKVLITEVTLSSVIGIPSSTSYILTYDWLLHSVLPPLISSETFVPMAAGIVARTAITSLASPLELIRTNLQSTPLSPDNPNTLRSVLSSVRNLVHRHGVLFLWRGLGPTLWRDVPFSGIYWASYESMKKAFHQRNHDGAWVAFISGATSGMFAAVITSPFDVLKTRRQALIMSSSHKHISSTIPLLLKMIRTEGIPALFAGNMPRMAKIAPACGIMIASYEVRAPFIRNRIANVLIGHCTLPYENLSLT